MRPLMLTISKTWFGPAASCGSGGLVMYPVRVPLSSLLRPSKLAGETEGGVCDCVSAEKAESRALAAGVGESGGAPSPGTGARRRCSTTSCRCSAAAAAGGRSLTTTRYGPMRGALPSPDGRTSSAWTPGGKGAAAAGPAMSTTVSTKKARRLTLTILGIGFGRDIRSPFLLPVAGLYSILHQARG